MEFLRHDENDRDDDAIFEIQIGTQEWMTLDLNVTTFRNGDQLDHAADKRDWEEAGHLKTPAWCYFNNDPYNPRLYNYWAISDKRNIAPEGWEVPYEWDWQFLLETLGGHQSAGEAENLYEYKNIGNKLKCSEWLPEPTRHECIGFDAKS